MNNPLRIGIHGLTAIAGALAQGFVEWLALSRSRAADQWATWRQGASHR